MDPVIVVTGPTGSGKSHIIYSLSKNYPVEIINADSRQIYRHMNIGTAMPDQNQMQHFPHHLFSFLDPSQPFSAGQYLHMCQKAIDEIHGRNRIPVIVGGTFFYIKSLWDGLIENIEIPEGIREYVLKLNKDNAYTLLTQRDPERAKKLFISDEHRVKRSLMLLLSTNRKISDLERSGGIYTKYTFHSFYIDMERSVLYNQINERVKIMFEKGLLEEVKKLCEMGYTISDPGLNAIGYKEILQIRDAYKLDLNTWSTTLHSEVIEKISQATRNFAKRQLTWFRNEPRLKRIDPVRAISLLSGLILQKKINEDS